MRRREVSFFLVLWENWRVGGAEWVPFSRVLCPFYAQVLLLFARFVTSCYSRFPKESPRVVRFPDRKDRKVRMCRK